MLWEFIDDNATFRSAIANRINTLYFPLCNASPIMSSLSPDLHGDLKTGFNSFLLEPVSRLSLRNSRSSRNFWVYIDSRRIWSAAGVSKHSGIQNDEFRLEAGLLWHKITRKNKKIGLEAAITSFIPASAEPVELMFVEITNISGRKIKFIPTAAIPIFGRSANSLHDHRHVTSLLNRIRKEKFGVLMTPALVFDESGHRKNLTSYFVLGTDAKNNAPLYVYLSQEEFTGEDSDLEAPRAVMHNLPPSKASFPQGKEAMGALKFKPCTLKPKATTAYIILIGIIKDKSESGKIFSKFNTPKKIKNALALNKDYWQQESRSILLETGNRDFDHWFKWVNLQPVLRKIFGCSFLPDFDYGKGARGWRDLWQDSLGLILNNPKEARSLLMNNFRGVRIDGSNATLIGQKPGEFIADRNNISRVWMDHGAWPLLTTHLYIQQTGDLNLLLDQASYFRDHQLLRAKARDINYSPAYGKELKTKSGRVYQGSILEHILVQTLVQFFNVGPHNHILLEGADWNDGLDMASQYGESVAFSAMYAHNLNILCAIIGKLKHKDIVILKELAILLGLGNNKIDYADIRAKRKVLNQYFKNTKYAVCGKKISVRKDELIRGLKRKADWMHEHIRNREWLKEGFFNGYYDNRRQRVEGNINAVMRMTLAGQVFPVLSGIATTEQVKILFSRAKKYLWDKKLRGFHLNTDFKAEQPNLGRAFSFVYGDKENGAFFNHMNTMFAYALYQRGFAAEGYQVLSSIYEMAMDTGKSRIYPGIPEYFNAQGQGMYSYLTGSASWFVLTLLTEVFGIKGGYGDLVIEPKLTAAQFKAGNTIFVTANFADKRIQVKFVNPARKNFGSYSIRKVSLNGKIIMQDMNQGRITIRRDNPFFLSSAVNIIEIFLD